MDSVTGRLEATSLEDSPARKRPRRAAADEDDGAEEGGDAEEGNGVEEGGDAEEMPASRPVDDEEDGKVARRKSSRPGKPVVDSMYASAASTPAKRRMKRRRPKSVLYQTKGKAGRRARKRVKAYGLARIVKLRVEGRALPGRETEFHQIAGKLATAVRTGQGLCLCSSRVHVHSILTAM
jgi:hypothetical protein